MHCFNRLTFNFEDIAKVTKTDLIAKIMEQFYDEAIEPYDAFLVHPHEILDYKFKLFLAERHLNLIPHGFVILCKPFTKGLTHTDYISNLIYDPIIENSSEYSDFITDKQSYLHKNRNYSKSYHVSLHVQLTQSGSMDWFKENAPTNLYVNKEGKVPYWAYQGDQLLSICDRLTDTGVSICRTDVLHLSNNEFSATPRLVLAFRFAGNPTFEQVKTKLQDFVIERE